MTVENQILQDLAAAGAVLTGSHFVYTSGMHGRAYVNMREVGHDAPWLAWVGEEIGDVLRKFNPDVIIGPETLGRTLAEFAGAANDTPAVWCDINEVDDGRKEASFSPKFGFMALMPNARVAIVDDLLTTGSSIKLVADLVDANGGEVITAVVVVRRTPDVTAEKCGVPGLEVLAEVSGFEVFTEEECRTSGPCSERIPVKLRPGHGWRWIQDNPDYPVA